MNRSIGFKGLLVCALVAFGSVTMAAGLELVLEAPQKSYVTGEPIELSLKAVNKSGAPVDAAVLLHAEAGYVLFYVETEPGEFKQYLGPGWATRDVMVRPATIRPGVSMEERFTLLWHNVLPGDDTMLREPLVFAEERCYRVKAKSLLPGFAFEGQSNPIEICVKAATGPDRVLWDAMVAEPQLARFIQRPIADVPTEVRDQAATFVAGETQGLLLGHFRNAVDVRENFERRVQESGAAGHRR